MSFQVDRNFNTQQSRFYESHNCNHQNQPQTNSNGLQQPANQFLSTFFDFLSKAFSSNASSATPRMSFSNDLFTGLQPQKVEDYGGFKFKNADEKAKVDQALQELRAEQTANPGKKTSKKFKIGKYKFRVTLDENGDVNIKKKKKKRGLFGKIGSAFKKIGKKVGGFLKKALPIVSTLAMFVPGLQPFALAARIGTSVMGVVDGIKNGNIFGAVMSGFGALSGMGGKVGAWASNLTSKANGILGNMGTNLLGKMGNTGTFISNMFTKGTGLLNQGKNWLSTFTGNAGNKVSEFIFGKGSNILGDLSKSFGGKVGNWLTQKGPDLLRSFSNRMGQKATNWLNDKATRFIAKLTDNPISRRFNRLMQSPFAQIFINMLRRNRA